MAEFLFTYRAPTEYTPGADTKSAWHAWFASMGDNLADVGNPVFESRTLGDCASNTMLGGYSIVTADDLEAAVALANGCPFLASGGGVEVGELTRVFEGTFVTTVEDHARTKTLAG
jgi:YCII-related domain